MTLKGNWDRAIHQMQELRKSSEHLKPVMEIFVTDFRKYIARNFYDRRDPGTFSTWVRLSDKYARWKYKKVGNMTANLRLTDRLFKAVKGGAGWFEDYKDTNVEFGIEGIPYAAIHQFGGIAGQGARIPARPYFLTGNGAIPVQILDRFANSLNKYFLKAMGV